MDDKHLDSLLEQVRAELQHVDHMDEGGLTLLRDLEQDIHALLERTDMPETGNMLERMQRAVEQLEVKYPTLTTLLSEISAILSNAGI